MNESNDRALRDLYRRLKDAESAAAPSYGQVVKRARGEGALRPARRLVLAAGATVFIAALATYSILSRRAGNGQLATPAWRSPTAFLLDTPGRDLLNSVPTLATGTPPAASLEWRNEP